MSKVYESLEGQIFPQVKAQVIKSLKGGEGTVTKKCLALIPFLNRNADQLTRTVLMSLSEDVRRQTAPACQKGCDECCSMKVRALQPELILIAEFLEKNLSPELFKAQIEKLSETVDQLAACQSEREELKVACSFLDNGACSIYDVRPLTCRAWNSTEHQACIDYLERKDVPIPTSICHFAAYDIIKKGVEEGLEESGIYPALIELNQGVLNIMNQKRN